jgi:hypothetical protein
VKIGFNIGKQFAETSGGSLEEAYYVKRPVEAAVSLSDKINQAYIRSLFNDTYVISGQ